MNLLESKTVLPDSNGVQSLTPALPPHLPSNGANYWRSQIAAKRLSQEIFDFSEVQS
jgi:hypothetical protein